MSGLGFRVAVAFSPFHVTACSLQGGSKLVWGSAQVFLPLFAGSYFTNSFEITWVSPLTCSNCLQRGLIKDSLQLQFPIVVSKEERPRMLR